MRLISPFVPLTRFRRRPNSGGINIAGKKAKKIELKSELGESEKIYDSCLWSKREIYARINGSERFKLVFAIPFVRFPIVFSQ